nr:unnamed protein product [Callosobruchus chinensis]
MNDIDVADEILENYNNIVTAECENLFDINKILLTNENAQNMTILHYNIRSLRANFDELCINVNKFNERRNIVAIILSETWYIDDISYFNIDGFTVYYNGASFNKCDGVVSMLECNIELDKYNLNIIGVYRPNPTNTQVFIEDMDDYLTKLIKNDISVIIGDVNIDINHNNKLSTESLAYTNMLSKNGFVQQISVPTRVDGDSATTIDHIATFVNNISKSKVKFNSLVLHNSLTDHYPLFYNIEFSEQKPETLRTARHIKIKQFDEVGFLNEIKTINWDALYSCQDPQVATDMFFENFNKMAERHTLEVKINNKKYKIKPWMTSGLLTSIRKRDSLKKEVLKEKNNIQLKQTFKSYRNFNSIRMWCEVQCSGCSVTTAMSYYQPACTLSMNRQSMEHIVENVLKNPTIITAFIIGAGAIFMVYILKLFRSDDVVMHEHKQKHEKCSILSEKKKDTAQGGKTGKKKAVVESRRPTRSDKQAFAHSWLLTSLKGHTGSILDMDFSNNGKYLASCADDRAVFIFEVKDLTQKDKRSLRVNIDFDFATHVKWSPDSKAVIIHKSHENVLEVYKVEKKKDGWLQARMGIASNGKYIMTCSNKTDMVIWDLKGQKLAVVDTYLMNTTCAKLSPCGRFVVASGFTPEARVWEVIFKKSGEFQEVKQIKQLTLGGHSSGVYDVAFDLATS